MDTTPLDNPAWFALTGRHAHLAQRNGPIVRYPPDVSPFAAFENIADMAVLPDNLAEGETALIWWPEDLEAPAGLDMVLRFPLLQMVAPGFSTDAAAPDWTPDVLGVEDVPDIIALTTLTRPGPFASRTIDFGHYIGIRQQGQLIALTGERMKPGGFTEMSAICTHPDFQGRGLARSLIQIMGRRIVRDGFTPFLHALPDNRPALALYEKMGFVVRRQMYVHLLRKPGGDIADDPFFSSL